MLRVFLALFFLAITIYSLIDCARTDDAKLPARIAKPIWIVAIAIVPVLGALLWLGFKTQRYLKSAQSYNSASGAGRFSYRNKNNATGAVAPDDDPDFLSRLEAQNRRRQYEQKKAEENPKQPPKDKDTARDERDDDDPPRGLYR